MEWSPFKSRILKYNPIDVSWMPHVFYSSENVINFLSFYVLVLSLLFLHRFFFSFYISCLTFLDMSSFYWFPVNVRGSAKALTTILLCLGLSPVGFNTGYGAGRFLLLLMLFQWGNHDVV